VPGAGRPLPVGEALFVDVLIDGIEGGHDHDADPLHMMWDHVGLDLGLFSRRREPAAR
jgi:hypothetical protein